VVARLDFGGDFGGARPYAITEYRKLGDGRSEMSLGLEAGARL
jgi:hypothetical protein